MPILEIHVIGEVRELQGDSDYKSRNETPVRPFQCGSWRPGPFLAPLVSVALPFFDLSKLQYLGQASRLYTFFTGIGSSLAVVSPRFRST